MKNADEILKGPDYFYCKKARCKLKVETCLIRQEAIKKHIGYAISVYEICRDCNQGVENRRQADSDELSKLRNPVNEKGQKDALCKFYNKCMDAAALKFWEMFCCDHCSYFKKPLRAAQKGPVERKQTFREQIMAEKQEARKKENKARIAKFSTFVEILDEMLEQAREKDSEIDYFVVTLLEEYFKDAVRSKRASIKPYLKTLGQVLKIEA